VATKLSPSNPKRVSLTVFNPSGVDIYIGKDSSIDANGNGPSLPVKANGGSVVFSPPKPYLGEIWFISSGANVNIFAFEDNESETAAV